jgi:prepilin-type N-terminal cleavage/methylation domain-containing protein
MVSQSFLKNRSTTSGFTMVEAMICIAIMAMVAAVAMPMIGNVTRLSLRKSSMMLAATIQATYDEAALTGETHRLVFNLNDGTVKVQRSATTFRLTPGSNALVAATKAPTTMGSGLTAMMAGVNLEEGWDEPEAKEGDEGSGAAAALFGIGGLQDGSNTTSFQDTDTIFTLEEGVKIMDVWIEGSDQPIAEGEASLIFFPHGYTQDAMVHLEDENSRVFTVKVWSLTGRAEVLGLYVEGDKSQ